MAEPSTVSLLLLAVPLLMRLQGKTSKSTPVESAQAKTLPPKK